MPALIALSLAASMATVAPPADNFETTFTQITTRIAGAFYDRAERADEMKTRFAKFAPRAKSATSRENFADIVNEMIAEFKDSHFAFLPDHSQGYYLFDGLARGDQARSAPTIGAWFGELKPGEYSVRMIMNGQAAEAAGLRKGDVMLTVGGQPFSPITALRPLVGKMPLFKWRRGSNEMSAEIPISEMPAMRPFLDGTRNSARVIESNGKKFGYVHLWTQAPSGGFQEALHSLIGGRLARTDGMILDLRDGFGGVPDGFSDPFWRPDMDVRYSAPGGGGQVRPFGYARPLVVIINGGSRSAKEVLSRIFQITKRATLVGSRTAGHVLGTTPMRLNDWSYLEIPIVKVTVNGENLEDKGVMPDVAVEQEFDAAGNDLFLAKAVEVLAEKVASTGTK
jgi:carboxyl-terminal processing protease